MVAPSPSLSLFRDSSNARKFKPTRGGGRHFSRDLDDRMRPDTVESSSEEESSEEEEDDEVEHKLAPEMAALNLKLGNTVAVDEDGEELSRAERKALKKKAAAKAEAEEAEAEDDIPSPVQTRDAEPSRRER